MKERYMTELVFHRIIGAAGAIVLTGLSCLLFVSVDLAATRSAALDPPVSEEAIPAAPEI